MDNQPVGVWIGRGCATMVFLAVAALCSAVVIKLMMIILNL